MDIFHLSCKYSISGSYELYCISNDLIKSVYKAGLLFRKYITGEARNLICLYNWERILKKECQLGSIGKKLLKTMIPQYDLLFANSPQYLLIKKWHDYYKLKEEIEKKGDSGNKNSEIVLLNNFKIRNEEDFYKANCEIERLKQWNADTLPSMVPKGTISPLNPYGNNSFPLIVELNQWHKDNEQSISFKEFASIVKYILCSLPLEKMTSVHAESIQNTLDFLKKYEKLLKNCSTPGVITLQLFPELQNNLEKFILFHIPYNEEQDFLQFYLDTMVIPDFDQRVNKFLHIAEDLYHAENAFKDFEIEEKKFNNGTRLFSYISYNNEDWTSTIMHYDTAKTRLEDNKLLTAKNLQVKKDTYEKMGQEFIQWYTFELALVKNSFNSKKCEKYKDIWRSYLHKKYPIDISCHLKFSIENFSVDHLDIYYKELLNKNPLLLCLYKLEPFRKTYTSLNGAEFFHSCIQYQIEKSCKETREQKSTSRLSPYKIKFEDLVIAFQQLLENLEFCQVTVKSILSLQQKLGEQDSLRLKKILNKHNDFFEPSVQITVLREWTRSCSGIEKNSQKSGETIVEILKTDLTPIFSAILPKCISKLIPEISAEEFIQLELAVPKISSLLNAVLLKPKFRAKMEKSTIAGAVTFLFKLFEPTDREVFNKWIDAIKSQLLLSFKLKNESFGPGLGELLIDEITEARSLYKKTNTTDVSNTALPAEDLVQLWLEAVLDDVTKILNWINFFKPLIKSGMGAFSYIGKNIAEDGWIGKSLQFVGYGKKDKIKEFIYELIDGFSFGLANEKEELIKKTQLKQDEEILEGMEIIVNIALNHIGSIQKLEEVINVYVEFIRRIKNAIEEGFDKTELSQYIKRIAVRFLHKDFPALEEVIFIALENIRNIVNNESKGSLEIQ